MTDLHKTEILDRYTNHFGNSIAVLSRTAVASGWLYQHINTAGRSDAVTFVPDDDAPHVRKLRADRHKERNSKPLFRTCQTCADGLSGECPDCGSVPCGKPVENDPQGAANAVGIA